MIKPQISNDEIILNYIRRHGPVSKAIIARKTGITPPTVTNICGNLIAKGLVYEDRQERSALGRPSMLLGFNNNTETILVAHIRTHAIVFYVTTVGQKILHQSEVSIIGCSAEEIMQQLYHGIHDLVTNEEYAIGCIGLILRGPVDSSKGISIYSPNGKWNNIPFKYILEERFHLPVHVENDVRCLSTGEYYFGSGKDIDNLIVLKFSYGLGVSLIYHGELYRGVNDSAGEIGYAVISLANGEEGRLESIASETSIHKYVMEQISKGRHTSVADDPLVTSGAFRVEPIYEAAVEGDEVCFEALTNVGHYLGVALANITNLFNPERIILSSAMGNAAGIMDPIVRKVIERHSYKANPIDLVYSSNGSFYTLLGMIDIVSAKRAAESWLV